MEKWLANNLQISIYNLVPNGNLKELLDQPVQERPHFSMNAENITIPRYFIRLIGIPGEEDVYYNTLYELDKHLSKYNRLYLALKNGCHEHIEKNLLRDLNIMWSKLLNFSEINSSIVIQMLDNAKLLIDFPNPALSKQIRMNLRGLIDYYFEINNNSVDPNEFKQLLFYLVYWINLYFENLFISFDYTRTNPKILYYGDISKEEIYFLIFMSSFGADVLYINPLRNCDFPIIDRNGMFTVKQEFDNKGSLQPFPTEKRATRARTVAHHASEQLNQQLGQTSSYFKPWQLTNHKPVAITLKTTYDEIYLICENENMFRSEWNVENNVVYLPNIFAKVAGVHKNINQYWKEIWKLTELENVLFVKQLPLSEKAQYERDYANYWRCQGENGKIDVNKLMGLRDWPYKQLPMYIQTNIANAIAELCTNSRFVSCFTREEEQKIEIFSRLLQVERQYLQMMQKFDYPKHSPKIVIYNNEDNGDITWHDCILLAFLNYLGFDIIIYNPSGHMDIENYIQERYFDIHRLDEIKFNLPYKEKSLLSRIFKK